MILTKTDFKEYLICHKFLWFKKKRPDDFVPAELTDFLQKLIAEGYEVEREVQKMYPSGINVSGDDGEKIRRTRELMEKDATIFQATFETPEGLFAKIDMLRRNEETGKWDVYEIKSSSEIKTDLLHNHIKDITFQTIVAERAGVDVGKSFIIHINKDYTRHGEIEPEKLFVFADMTVEIAKIKSETMKEMKSALDMLDREDVNLEGCDCIYKSHGQRCDTFAIFNPQIPKYSTAHIVSGRKLMELNDMFIFDVKDIPDDFELTEIQRERVELQKTGVPKIHQTKIRETLNKLEYPLYFLDYETLGKPIPILDGYKTNQHLVFQYSLHVLHKDDKLEHFEYLANDLENATSELLKSLRENIGDKGTVIVWNEMFEKGKNEELALLHPEYASFLKDINSRVFDLMKVFKRDYLHPEFYGSASIKKVLPIMVPGLSYKDLNVRDGGMAMSAWEEMLVEEDRGKRGEIRKNLLEYCKLDTFAMLEIYRKLLEELKA